MDGGRNTAMTKLTLITASLALALTAACGDNLEADLERDDLIVIIPHAGQAIDALESAELVGFEDPLFFEDVGYITALGDLSLADEAMDLPGIAEVLPADAIDGSDWNDRVVWDRNQAFDLGQAVVNQTPDDYWEQRTDWNGQLALDNVPDPVKRDRAIDWDETLSRR
jgi:hypothetical protein